MYYFAYGMNVNRESMAARCPRAVPQGAAYLPGWRLTFRGPADVEPAEGELVHGVLWWVTPDCEEALDALEGYPRLYGKQFGRVRWQGRDVPGVMFYSMKRKHLTAQPSSGYLAVVHRGYLDFNLPEFELRRALHAIK